MSRVRPGWLVALCAVVLLVSAWLPWLTTNGGRASAIGGLVDPLPDQLRDRLSGFGVGQLIVLLASVMIVAGAMAARGLSARMAASVALAISVLLVVLIVWYYRLFVYPPVHAGFGLYIAASVTVVAVLLSVWTMAAAWSAATRVS